ncbi:MAG: 3-phenylpropionate-dihydrodiol/cinnamic acid-dihydrodiol dehydrogenase [Gemmatimonadaceae bacterium]|nr:3-phenylpropionate-dihydrodiol/cinnamic acid-dihydrodiol dehydrogenase [Gemmatimonadaceae bacterium]
MRKGCRQSYAAVTTAALPDVCLLRSDPLVPELGAGHSCASYQPYLSRDVSDTTNLEGRTALITGGTRGIGLAIARGLGSAGATVVVSSRKEPAVSAAVNDLRASGISAHGVLANVGRMDEAMAMVDRAIDLTGGIDILVNNAATNPVFGPLAETSTEAFDKIMAVNLKAPFEIGKRALASMKARGGGVVLNVSSVAGLSPESGLGTYSVSKAALISLTQVMAREWGCYNVRANALCPGFIRTDFSAALWTNERLSASIRAQQPIPRWGEADEVAEMAVFLCSDRARFCTGAWYVVDGGFMIRDQFATIRQGPDAGTR